jgi:hypothetical protein
MASAAAAFCAALQNEEGGLGIFFYKNAVVDGDWVSVDVRISHIASHVPQ